MNKTSKTTIKQADRRRQVVQLRAAGRTIAEIADTLNVSKATIDRDIASTLLTLQAEAVADLDAWRSTQLAASQHVRTTAMEAADSVKDREKIAPLLGVALKALEREARLLGLDKYQPNILVPVLSDAEAQAILDELP